MKKLSTALLLTLVLLLPRIAGAGGYGGGDSGNITSAPLTGDGSVATPFACATCTTDTNIQTLTNKTFTAPTIGASGTAITQIRVYTPTLDPTSIAAATTEEQTYTISGLTTADTVILNKPTHTAGCLVGNVRVSAVDTLAITWGNVQAVVACDPASEVYRVIAVRN